MAVAVCTATSGCSQVAVAPTGNCSPEYVVGGAEGRLAVRQEGRGKSIAWGIYVAPEYKTGTTWVVKVYAGGTRIDGKNQAYEPHGSVSAARALKYSGKVLEISGTATHNRSDVLTFDGKCKIA